MQRWERRARRWQVSAEQRRLRRSSAESLDSGSAADQAARSPPDVEHQLLDSSAWANEPLRETTALAAAE
jgi:hypothetical protein